MQENENYFVFIHGGLNSGPSLHAYQNCALKVSSFYSVEPYKITLPVKKKPFVAGWSVNGGGGGQTPFPQPKFFFFKKKKMKNVLKEKKIKKIF